MIICRSIRIFEIPNRFIVQCRKIQILHVYLFHTRRLIIFRLLDVSHAIREFEMYRSYNQTIKTKCCILYLKKKYVSNVIKYSQTEIFVQLNFFPYVIFCYF